MGNLIVRVIISIVSVLLFVLIFLLSDQQRWPLWLTIVLVIILFIVFNIGYVWLYWQKKKLTLGEDNDD
ncbi:hypothetical protein GCM10025879_06380 [Leuconostoc litchii]|uniref:Uncharacterized protein n=1 Tax=Leuconostoc litchii TaxID=1981069 RepID=A0A6P2CQI9_9LACO|nr:hypothetical protein [Leuconostoc litchii]TYC47382.1 hypothetical protein ESZ47_04380 [Leuconostoc litchii]GMA69392.1 hypothetical protein GCM10025879_06380 [Leuconostoc litchii]